MKRLRFNTGQKIRFFAAGEYGTNSFRPHYHALFFGLRLDDLTPYKKSPQGYPYFNSATLDKCWTDDEGNSKGFIVVGRLTWETCAYTARYIMKKQRGPEAAESYAALGLSPEFSLMSRRPGIARQYYDDHPEMWKYDLINLSTSQGGKSMPHPLYFRRLFEIDDPLTAREFSEVRRLKAIRKTSQKMRLTDKEYCDMLVAEEEVRLSRIKALRRNLI
nr:MAG: replication initiator protein [Gokushovirinae sp.]